MLNIVALVSLLYLLVGGALAVRRRRSGSRVLTPSSVSREWLVQYQIHERPAHY